MSITEKRAEYQQIGFNFKSSAMNLFEACLKGMDLISEEELLKIKGTNEDIDIYMTEGLYKGDLEYNVHFDIIQMFPPNALDTISPDD